MIITIKDKDYDLRMTTRNALELEKKLGFNPVNVFVRMYKTEELPPLDQVLTMFHYCLLKMNHGISFSETLDLYDDYIMEGGSIASMIEVIVGVFQEAGILAKEADEGNA